MKKILLAAAVIFAMCSYSYAITVEELVDQYQHATDLQKQDLEKTYIGKRISASGMVDNVAEYNFFDIDTDTGESYYRVITRQQETAGKTPYQIIFMYKDRSKLVDISRGQTMKEDGILINLVDERLQIAVWIYEDELTAKDKQLFKIN
jgi:hypothetical protein